MGAFSQPYLKLSPVLVTRSDKADITSLAQLNHGKVAAIPAGWAFVTTVRQNYPKIQVLEVKDTLAALKAVHDGRADAAFDNNRVVQYFIDRYALQGLILHTGFDDIAPQIDQQLRLLVHWDQPELRDLFNKAIQSLTQAELNAIEAKWLDKSASARMKRSINSGMVPDPTFLTLATRSMHNDAMIHDVMIGGTSYTVFVHHIPTHLGLDSYAGIMMPTVIMQKPYMKKVFYSLVITLGLLTIIIPVLVYFTKMIVMPVNLLAKENEKIKQRKFKDVKHIPSHIREFNDLSHSALIDG
ncbi:transporter substrate-binding domain-containing protein [Vibrio sp. PP-XX7]